MIYKKCGIVLVILIIVGMIVGCIEKEEVQTNLSYTPTPILSRTPTLVPTPEPSPTPTPSPTPIPLKTITELDYSKANGEPITLINYRDSKNPTFQELKKFIKNDKTDKYLYNEFSYVCGDFAERVHNNAEAKGIKAGLAIITFKNDVVGHAINVFDTKDYGLIYIDCTGKAPFYREYGEEYFCDPILTECSKDGFAYIEENKEYGIISMDIVNFNTKYEYYEVFKDNAEDFWCDIDLYNKERLEYNIEVRKYNRDVTSFDNYWSEYPYYLPKDLYERYCEEKDDLDDRSQELDSWDSTLDIKLRNIENREETYCCVWESLGIVEDVEIIW